MRGLSRDVRLLVAAGTVSQVGSFLLVVAVPYQAFRLTGSAASTGLALAVEAAPAVLVGPWAGALVDRWNRRAVMACTDLAAAGGVAVLLLATTPGRLPLYAGLLAESVAVTFHRPAARAVLPDIAGTGPELAGANAALAFAGGAVRLAGPPLGTTLLSVGGLGIAVGLDVASYLGAAALTAALTGVPAARGAGGGFRRMSGEVLDGSRRIAGSRTLRGLLVVTWAYWTANAALTALLVPFTVLGLHRGGQDVGVLVGGLGAGYLAGSAVSRRLVGRFTTRGLLTGGYLAVGAALLALFHAPGLVAATVFAALAGIPGAVVTVAAQQRIQTDVPSALLGRVGAVFFAGDALAALAGAGLAPAAVAFAGLPSALTGFGVAVLGIATITPALLPAGVSVGSASVRVPGRTRGGAMAGGVLIGESLRPGAELAEPLRVVRVRRIDVPDEGAGQPDRWTLLDFEVPDGRAAPLAEALAGVLLADGGWYANLNSAETAHVVFAGRAFAYPRGDAAGRAEAAEYGRSVGVPEAQLDWED